jgi:hypothetical protein
MIISSSEQMKEEEMTSQMMSSSHTTIITSSSTSSSKMTSSSSDAAIKVVGGPGGDILLGLERGPEPEILIAPSASPSWTKSSQNQVLQKAKTFEQQQLETPGAPPPPSGGVRIIPIKEVKEEMMMTPAAPGFSVGPKIPLAGVKPIPPPKPRPTTTTSSIDHSLPLLFPTGQPIIIQHPPPPPPKPTRPSSATSFFLEPSSPSPSPAMRSLSPAPIRPSKFIPEKMRESDYESDSSPIPPKWLPPGQQQQQQQVSPVPPPAPVTTTTTSTSAFVPATSSIQFVQQPQQLQQVSPGIGGCGVRSLIKSWPPAVLEEEEEGAGPSFTRGSPSFTPIRPHSPLRSLAPTGGRSSSRSPTPNREALLMEKQWTKARPFTGGGSSSPATPAASPQWKPQVPPKPSSGGGKSPVYYLGVVSPPRTTPIPGEFSFVQEEMVRSSSSSSFYEQRTSSTSTMTTKEEQSSSNVTLVPGEEPQFLYAPPPPPPKPKGQGQASPGGGGGQRYESSSMTSSSSSEMKKQVFFNK